MKKILFTSILLAASYGFAADPQPSLEGTWELTSRSCTSNTAINDGVKIGEDSLSLTNNADYTFQLKMTVAGCETNLNGAYVVDGMKVDYTSVASQSCKDAAPVPMVETYSIFFAYLDDEEAVGIVSGDKAAMSCPAGDALVMHFNKLVTP